MSMTDPIADLLTRIRNAHRAKHRQVRIPASNLKVEIVKILQREGFVEAHRLIDDSRQGQIEVDLKYGPGGARCITGLERVSRPGRRIYRAKDEIPKVLDGLGITVVSTSRGMMTGSECRMKGIGGEVLCSVW